MKLIRNTIVALCLGAAALGAWAAREGAPIIDHLNMPVSTRGAVPMTAGSVRAAIVAATQAKGWTTAETTPGTLTATLVVRNKHTVMVDIPYSATSYSVKYRDSVNMNYEPTGTVKRGTPGPQAATTSTTGPLIHPFYNRWVQDLVGQINTELAR